MTPDAEERKHTRRAWKIVGAMALLLAVAFFIVLRVDDPLNDCSAVVPHFTPGGGDDNPLAVFVREISAPLVANPSKLREDIMARKPGSDAAMREFAEKRADRRLVFDQLMNTDASSWRWPKVDDGANFDVDRSYLPKIVELAGAQYLQVLDLAQKGKSAEATAEALKLTKCGNALLRAEGTVMHWLVATTTRRIGESSLEQALNGPDVTTELLRRTQEELADLEIRGTDLAFSFRVDMAVFRNSIKKRDAHALAAIPENSEFGLPSALLIKPNRTINALQAAFTSLFGALEHSDWSRLSALRISYERQAQIKHSLISANAVGNRLIQSSLQGFGKLITDVQAAPAIHRLTLIILAMRRFELVKGKLPVSLDELVPEYLSSVPLDPFDSAPMRWNAAKQIVYSVGSDLKDDGGTMAKYGAGSEPDLGLRYWWAAP